MAIARITSKGRVTVPKEVRERLGIEPGDALDFHFQGERLEVRPVWRRHISEFRGIFRIDRALDFDQERALARQARVRHLVDRDQPSDA